MIVCDLCRRLEVRLVSEVHLRTVKVGEDPKRKGAYQTHKGGPHERTVISIPFHLCEDCLDILNRQAQRMASELRVGSRKAVEDHRVQQEVVRAVLGKDVSSSDADEDDRPVSSHVMKQKGMRRPQDPELSS